MHGSPPQALHASAPMLSLAAAPPSHPPLPPVPPHPAGGGAGLGRLLRVAALTGQVLRTPARLLQAGERLPNRHARQGWLKGAVAPGCAAGGHALLLQSALPLSLPAHLAALVPCAQAEGVYDGVGWKLAHIVPQAQCIADSSGQ